MNNNKQITNIIQGDCLEVLKTLPDTFVDCCITSPPYYGLRDYGVNGQIGLEKTPEEYISRLVDVFREVKRVLKDDGTLWLNIGDSYWGSGSRGFNFAECFTEKSKLQQGSKGTIDLSNLPKLIGNKNGYKNKDLIGIPWMLAFALRADGWYLRQDIIWHKPNPMPESVTDRCTKSHEYIFLLSKSPHYYYDYEAIQEDANEESRKRYKYVFNAGKAQEHFRPGGATNTMGIKKPHIKYKNLEYNGQTNHTMHERRAEGEKDIEYMVRNKRDVWTVNVQAVRDSHFATFPEKLIQPCILAGCRRGGIVLDPFFGSGTTGRVATQLNRQYLGIELNPEYIEIAKRRTDNVQTSIFEMEG